MKIVFLDIDGVLCTHRAHYAQGCPAPNGIMHALDREAVGLVNCIALGIPGATVRIVLISTWRLPQHPVGQGGRDRLLSHLQEFGFQAQFHDDWRTPSMGDEKARGAEVADWLARHPEVTGAVIIDDGENFTDEQWSRHVKPDYAEGLSWQNFKDAMRILHGVEGLKP